MLVRMRVTITLLILCLSASPLSAAEAWRWVDAEGNVEYADTPRPGATRIELPEPMVVPARPPVAQTPVLDGTVADVATGTAVPYTAISITDPANEDTLRDNGGNLIVSVSLTPALQKAFGHRLQLVLDGDVVQTGTVQNFALTELDRGTHSVQAVVLGVDGAPLASSAVNTFHLHRTSLRQLERQKAARKKAQDSATP